MNDVIDTFLEENQNISAVEKWELLKLKIKDESIHYSKKLSISKRNRLSLLRVDLDQNEVKLSNNPNDNKLKQKIHELKMQIEVIEIEQLKSAQIRSKSKWIEEGERNTKYFLNLEKARANKKTISEFGIRRRNHSR